MNSHTIDILRFRKLFFVLVISTGSSLCTSAVEGQSIVGSSAKKVLVDISLISASELKPVLSRSNSVAHLKDGTQPEKLEESTHKQTPPEYRGSPFEIPKELSSIKRELSRLPYRVFALIESRTLEISQTEIQNIEFRNGYTLYLSPTSIGDGKSSLWLKWRDQNFNNILDTKILLKDGKTFLVGTTNTIGSDSRCSKKDKLALSSTPTQSKPTQSKPIQAQPTQANPTQLNPTQSNTSHTAKVSSSSDTVHRINTVSQVSSTPSVSKIDYAESANPSNPEEPLARETGILVSITTRKSPNSSTN
jgi:hypothetical protein